MRFFKPVAVFVVILVLLVLAAVILIARPRRHEATFYPMGGIPFKVVAYGRTIFQFEEDLDAVKGRVAELEAVFNRHNQSSELSRMKREAHAAPFSMSSDMARVFELSRKWHRETGGAFDPTVGSLVDLWRNAGREGKLPSEAEIKAAKQKVGLDLVASTGNGRILFAREGMGLDFGAIAKGYIADEAAEVLKARGVKRGLVQAGGDTLAFGDGTFRIGIQDPTAKAGPPASPREARPAWRAGEKIMGTIEMSAGGVSTSGNYERFVEIEGRRYSHIVDPRTGETVDNGLISATVVGGTATDADAIATALMVLGLEGSVELIKGLDWAKVVLVQQTMEGIAVWVSDALFPSFELARDWPRPVHIF